MRLLGALERLFSTRKDDTDNLKTIAEEMSSMTAANTP